MTTKFEIGKTYATRSICDYDCIHSFTIIARTAKMLTTSVHGEVVKRGIQIHDDVEEFAPFGRYSMTDTTARRYHFDLVCPKCGKASEHDSDQRMPSPHVNCGDCLMEHIEVVEFKVVKVTERAP